jgi:hypothetical protein
VPQVAGFATDSFVEYLVRTMQVKSLKAWFRAGHGQTKSIPPQGPAANGWHPTAPYAWAILADIAHVDGHAELAAEFVWLAYLASDPSATNDWD